MTVSKFVASALLGLGLCIVLYSTIPLLAWNGILLFAAGIVIWFRGHQRRLKTEGLKAFLPESVNELLMRTDLFDFFILKLRENSLASKLLRLFVVKSFELSRHETAVVLEGVWPGFRDLSEDVRLIDRTPRWFKGVYSPPKSLELDSDLDTFELDERSPSQSSNVGHQDGLISITQDRPPRRPAPITPLMLWLAERRIRQGLSEGLPVVRKWTLRTIVPLVLLFLVWRRYPRSRRPITGLSLVFTFLYILSVSRGLPGGFEKILKAMNISWYRRQGERPFTTDQNTGSVKAVLYALVEPFVPIVNVSNVCKKPRTLVPHSPALSQASTQDHAVM